VELYHQNGMISRVLKDHKPEILIAALAVVTYAVSLINTFHTDDWIVLSLLRDGFSWRDFLSMENMGRFRPLTNIIVYLRYLAFGDSPAPYYALNIVLHAFFGIFFYRFLNKIGLKPIISLLSAVIFTAYFQHYEAVLWLYGTIRILIAIFWIASLWTLYDYLITGKRSALIWFGIFSFLGYFVVEDFVVSPIGYLLFALLVAGVDKDAKILKLPKAFLSRIKLPMIISLCGLAFYFVLRSTSIVRPGVVEDYYYPGLHIFSRLYAYLQWMILPPPDHPYFQVLAARLSPLAVSIWEGLSISLVVISALALVYALTKFPGLIKFMVIFIVLALLPALPLNYKVTSRNIYIPSIGFAVLLGVLFYGIYERVKGKFWGRGLSYALLTGYLIINMAAVWVTSHEYHKNQAFVASLIADLKDSGVNFNNYDFVLFDHLPGRTIVGPAMIYKLDFTHEVIASNDPSAPGPIDIMNAAKSIAARKIPFIIFDYKDGHLREATADYINNGDENESVVIK
jgi:hypothetical protein